MDMSDLTHATNRNPALRRILEGLQEAIDSSGGNVAEAPDGGAEAVIDELRAENEALQDSVTALTTRVDELAAALEAIVSPPETAEWAHATTDKIVPENRISKHLARKADVLEMIRGALGGGTDAES